MAERESAASLLRSRDLNERCQTISLGELVLDILSDVLFDTDELLVLLRAAAAADYEHLATGVNEIHEKVRSMIEEISN